MSSSRELVLPGWAHAANRLATAEAGIALAVLLASLLAIAIQAGVAIQGVVPVLDGQLVDTDDYMRLVRVEQLWQTGAWFDPVIQRIDPPTGLALHWTRPMDVLLLAGAVLGMPLVGFQPALFWWGSLISPVLQIISLVAVVWAAAPLISRRWLPLVAFFYVAQPSNLARFLVGRPDHHGLLILLLVLAIGFGLRLAQDPARRSNAVLAGLVGAMAIWVSVESLIAVVAAMAAFGLSWLFNDRRYARALVAYSAGLCSGLAAALVIERGVADLLAVEVDKISIPHLAIFATSGVLWWALAAAEDRGRLGVARLWRAAWAAAGAGAMVLVLIWVFPQVLADPMNIGGDFYVRKHLVKVAEIQPLTTWSALAGENGGAALSRAILWLGIALPAVPWLVYRCFVGQIAERRMWAFIAVAALAFVPLTVHQVRWASYAETVLVLPYASLAAFVAARLASMLSETLVGVVRPFVIVGLCIWVFLPSVLAGDDGNAMSMGEGRKACSIKGLASALNDSAGLGVLPLKILAFIDYGPEILYRTRHSVMSVPNHRYQTGFAASYRIMSAEDFSVARQMLREKSVDLIMICPKGPDATFYEAEAGGRTLYQALSDDAPPPFLTPVPLPAEADAMRLFVVQPDA